MTRKSLCSVQTQFSFLNIFNLLLLTTWMCCLWIGRADWIYTHESFLLPRVCGIWKMGLFDAKKFEILSCVFHNMHTCVSFFLFLWRTLTNTLHFLWKIRDVFAFLTKEFVEVKRLLCFFRLGDRELTRHVCSFWLNRSSASATLSLPKPRVWTGFVLIWEIWLVFYFVT